jgi:hypothetical protein
MKLRASFLQDVKQPVNAFEKTDSYPLKFVVPSADKKVSP